MQKNISKTNSGVKISFWSEVLKQDILLFYPKESIV